MSERDNEELAKLKQNLAQDECQQKQKTTLVESIRVQLESIARESVAKYQREVEATRPEAQTAIDQVIQPWFTELVSTGTYAKLLKWSRSHEDDVSLSDTITYFWPNKALGNLAKGSKRLYLDTAKFVAENYKDQDIPRGVQIHAEGDRAWYTGFDLHSDDWDKSEGVRIWRRPVVGMGYGFAMMARNYDIPVDIQNVGASLDRISPEVWIKFGQQIETGRVWELIDQSMKPSEIVVLTVEETQKGRKDDNKNAEEYLKTRQWH